jgi:deoxycytidylate deaminase
MHSSYIDEAKRLACHSDVLCSSHGAVIIFRGKIIGRGYNKYCLKDKLLNRFSIHAEVSAIQDALRKSSIDDLKKSTLVIVRINNNYETLNSFPCGNCRKYIEDKGIKCIYYS